LGSSDVDVGTALDAVWEGMSRDGCNDNVAIFVQGCV
jgi:hypothetical protein